MGSSSLTGNDTLQIDDRLLTDLAAGDVAILTFPNELAAVKTGKNGNTIYAANEMGRQADLELKVLRGSSDDKYLLSRLQEQKNDFATFPTVFATFVKRTGDGTGNVNNDVYQCLGGVFKKHIETKSNAEGDTEQSVSVYHITFGNVQRSIQ